MRKAKNRCGRLMRFDNFLKGLDVLTEKCEFDEMSWGFTRKYEYLINSLASKLI